MHTQKEIFMLRSKWYKINLNGGKIESCRGRKILLGVGKCNKKGNQIILLTDFLDTSKNLNPIQTGPLM